MSIALQPASRLSVVLLANAMLRVAGGANAVLVGVYVADLAGRGVAIGAGQVGVLAAASFGAELVGSVPLGLVADATSTRLLMTGGALLAAVATLLFGLTHDITLFVVSRALEGLAAAAGVPALLAHLTDATSGDGARRARAMSYFELSLLVGLALGGLLGTTLWRLLGANAFGALALVYVVAALLMFLGATPVVAGAHAHANIWLAARRALAAPALRRLAPVWLCMNAIVGVWLGPTLYFLLTHETQGGQLMPGLFADDPGRLGWLLFSYALIFGTGLLVWSRVLPRVSLGAALRTSLVAMLGVCLGLLALNHMSGFSPLLRWALTAAISALVMVESGFTPAALSLLANAVGAAGGRGVAMGIYSFLLSLGAIMGSLLAGAVASRWDVDGLIYATLALAAVALTLSARLDVSGRASGRLDDGTD